MPAAAAIGGAGIGALAGSQGQQSNQTSSSSVQLAPVSGLEQSGRNWTRQGLDDFGYMVDAGPGKAQVAQSLDLQQQLANQYGRVAGQGGMPNSTQISQANQYASQVFAPQSVAMQQAFTDQNTAAARQAALMGRSGNDPILRAKLATEQTRQQAMLNANQGAFANQYAQQLPYQQLSLMGNQANIISGLASQAMANRQALIGLGQGIMSQEQNFRLASAGRSSNTSQSSGGGLGGALNGALAGAGAGMGAANSFSQMGAMNAYTNSMNNGGGGQPMAGPGNMFAGPNPFAGAPVQSQAPAPWSLTGNRNTGTNYNLGSN